MLRPRITPTLLIQRGGLVKTVNFKDPKYVGDPLNAVRIFNEKQVDELFIADIDCTEDNREPNYKLIAKLANECRMPLCYAGGISSIEQIETLISLGVEKVALGVAAVEHPDLLSLAAERIGNQSVVVVMDVKKAGLTKSYQLFTRNGRKKCGTSVAEFAAGLEAAGAGEIILNCIDKEGTMSGYDLKLATMVKEATQLPMTVVGGAGKLEDMTELFSRCGVIGAGAGSLFVFKGKYRAVLINYPSRSEKAEVFAAAL